MEEYRFEKIVNSCYKDEFYNQIYNKQNQAAPKMKNIPTQSMTGGHNITNKKVHFTTIYSSSYGSQQNSTL